MFGPVTVCIKSQVQQRSMPGYVVFQKCPAVVRQDDIGTKRGMNPSESFCEFPVFSIVTQSPYYTDYELHSFSFPRSHSLPDFDVATMDYGRSKPRIPGIRIPTLTLRQAGAKDDPASPTFSISRTCSFVVNFFMIPIFFITFSFHLSSIDCLITAASNFSISIFIDISASSLLFSSTFCNIHLVPSYFPFTPHL